MYKEFFIDKNLFELTEDKNNNSYYYSKKISSNDRNGNGSYELQTTLLDGSAIEHNGSSLGTMLIGYDWSSSSLTNAKILFPDEKGTVGYLYPKGASGTFLEIFKKVLETFMRISSIYTSGKEYNIIYNLHCFPAELSNEWFMILSNGSRFLGDISYDNFTYKKSFSLYVNYQKKMDEALSAYQEIENNISEEKKEFFLEDYYKAISSFIKEKRELHNKLLNYYSSRFDNYLKKLDFDRPIYDDIKNLKNVIKNDLNSYLIYKDDVPSNTELIDLKYKILQTIITNI